MQRFFDILFSSIAILLLSPLLLIVMMILLCTGEHEIFYLQERIGKNGKTFGVIKFATMLKNSPNIGSGTITTRNDPRVLPFGKILRKTKINELPQLFNIFIGNMSVIGPRPLVKEGFDAYSAGVKEIIGKVTPGLSGIGSVVFRDEEKYFNNPEIDAKVFYTNVIQPYKGALEVWYVKNRSISLYFKLIILTVISVLKSDSVLYKKWLKDLPEKPAELY